MRSLRALGDRWRNSLSLRLASLLSLALVPLGLIALSQTNQLQNELARVQALTLRALTAEVAWQKREELEVAAGAADALAAAVPHIVNDDPALCRAIFRRTVEASGGNFSFAGFIPVSRIMTCSSNEQTYDFTENPAVAEQLEKQHGDIRVNRNGEISGTSVMIVSEPVRNRAGTYLGYVTVSVPHTLIDAAPPAVGKEVSLDIFTLNADGQILTASLPLGEAEQILPGDRVPQHLTIGGRQDFVVADRADVRRVYAVVPVLEGAIYAVGSWPENVGGISENILAPGILPALMWLVSLVLVFVAVERLVVGPVRLLSARMRRFGQSRALDVRSHNDRLPSELATIDREFTDLAASLLRDEADLLDAMHDKDVLLKEVHHRVKNNLQLISSMINMQARRAANSETEAALEQINSRVGSMATVHRLLYQAENLGRVSADTLLDDVIRPLSALAPSGAMRPTITMDFDSVVLTPDQAVPVALLAVEAVTNAFKYIGPDGEGHRWLRVSLRHETQDTVTLSVESSVGDAKPAAEASTDSTGLGSRLIRGFARQLRSSATMGIEGDAFVVRVTFGVEPFDPTSVPPSHHDERNHETDQPAPDASGSASGTG